jgi:hypothetical protein
VLVVFQDTFSEVVECAMSDTLGEEVGYVDGGLDVLDGNLLLFVRLARIVVLDVHEAGLLEAHFSTGGNCDGGGVVAPDVGEILRGTELILEGGDPEGILDGGEQGDVLRFHGGGGDAALSLGRPGDWCSILQDDHS